MPAVNLQIISRHSAVKFPPDCCAKPERVQGRKFSHRPAPQCSRQTTGSLIDGGGSVVRRVGIHCAAVQRVVNDFSHRRGVRVDLIRTQALRCRIIPSVAISSTIPVRWEKRRAWIWSIWRIRSVKFDDFVVVDIM